MAKLNEENLTDFMQFLEKNNPEYFLCKDCNKIFNLSDYKYRLHLDESNWIYMECNEGHNRSFSASKHLQQYFSSKH